MIATLPILKIFSTSLSIAVTVILVLIIKLRLYFKRIRHASSSNKNTTVIGFFHPHCSAGGGGERVLWKALQALGELSDSGLDIKVVIYTIDREEAGVDYKEATLEHVKDRFSTSISQSLPIQFVHIDGGKNTGKKMSLIAQSADTIKLAWVALQKSTPHIFIDTTGCAFTFLVAKLAGCKIGAYVHYPTISTDMLNLVWERRPTYNNSAQITKSSFTSYLKLVYYSAFAVLYGLVGSLADLVMVNSSWTRGHISFLWMFARRKIHTVYPPCDTKSLESMNLTKRENIILSIGQFRPEKDHSLQINSFAKLITDRPECKDMNARLVLIGSCRGKDDEMRVMELKELAGSLGIRSSVDFVLNQPYPVLKKYLGRASVGIHTMWNEHFGIGVVEMMAAGLIVIAHNSGGPKSDIIVPYGEDKKTTGYLASSVEEYAEAMYRVLRNGPECSANHEVRIGARESVKRFSDEVFNESFKSTIMESLLR